MSRRPPGPAAGRALVAAAAALARIAAGLAVGLPAGLAAAADGDPAGDHAPGPEPIRLGWFGPSDPADPDGGPFWTGATLAAEEINAAGGIARRPLRLVPGWSDSPWAGGVSRVARMVYDDGVVAVIGSIDGAATHLAEQVAAKALVAVVSPGSTDPTVSLAGVPWMYSLLPGDDAQARVLAAWLGADAARRPIALIAATDHDARAAAGAFRAAWRAAGLAFAAAFECSPDAAEAATVAGQAVAAAPGSVVLLASPAASGRLAAALRAAGHDGIIAGGSNLGRRRFAEIAGAAAEGAIVPLVHDPGAPRWRAFARAHAARFGGEPDFAAGAGYDAVRLAADAAARAATGGAGGATLDRRRLLETLGRAGDRIGVMGVIAFDRRGRNLRPVGLGTIRGGGAHPLLPEGPGEPPPGRSGLGSPAHERRDPPR